MPDDIAQKDQSYGVIPFRFENNQRFFLLSQHVDGHWAFPKGHMEAGDKDVVETALRELREEVGIAEVDLVDNVSFVERYSFERDSQLYNKTVEYFLGEVKGPEPQLQLQAREVQAVKWLPGEQVLDQLTYEGTKKMFTQVLRWMN